MGMQGLHEARVSVVYVVEMEPGLEIELRGAGSHFCLMSELSSCFHFPAETTRQLRETYCSVHTQTMVSSPLLKRLKI